MNHVEYSKEIKMYDYNIEFAVGPVPRFKFGANVTKSISEDIKEFKVDKVLVVTDKGIVKAGIMDKINEYLKLAGVQGVIYDKISQNPPIEDVERGVKLLKQEGLNAVVAVGGGSVMDAAKCIAMLGTNEGSIQDYEGFGKVKESPLPLIAIPTTAGTGSEVNVWAVITNEKEKFKMCIGDPKMAPTSSLIDPIMTKTMPPGLTAATGVDALTHAIECYVTKDAQLLSDILSFEAIKLIVNNLRKAVANGDDIEARSNMLLGSTIVSIAFSAAGLGDVHALAHQLSSFCSVPHGIANAVLLPYIMEFNLIARQDKFIKIAEVMGENIAGLSKREAAFRAVQAVKELSADIGIPAITDLGIKEKDIPDFAGGAMKDLNLSSNPRKTTLEDVIKIYKEAFK